MSNVINVKFLLPLIRIISPNDRRRLVHRLCEQKVLLSLPPTNAESGVVKSSVASVCLFAVWAQTLASLDLETLYFPLETLFFVCMVEYVAQFRTPSSSGQWITIIITNFISTRCFYNDKLGFQWSENTTSEVWRSWPRLCTQALLHEHFYVRERCNIISLLCVCPAAPSARLWNWVTVVRQSCLLTLASLPAFE